MTNQAFYLWRLLLRNACVGDEGTMCLRENEVRAVFSLSFFSLRGYDVTKKVWYGQNMVEYTKTSKKNARNYSRDYYFLEVNWKSGKWKGSNKRPRSENCAWQSKINGSESPLGAAGVNFWQFFLWQSLRTNFIPFRHFFLSSNTCAD